MLILYGRCRRLGRQTVRGAFLPDFCWPAVHGLRDRARNYQPQARTELPKEQSDVPMRMIVKLLVTSFFPLAILILAYWVRSCLGWQRQRGGGVWRLGSILLAIGYRQFTFTRLKEAVYLTARTAAMVCWLFVGSWTFSSVFPIWEDKE